MDFYGLTSIYNHDDNPRTGVDAIEPCVLGDDEIPNTSIANSQPEHDQTQNDVQGTTESAIDHEV